MPSHQIEILSSSRIDKDKWDDCIIKSGHNLIYAHSYYLNTLADTWHGIVVNDYECVMPVPWRKKFGIRYCYDVPFIQQLGYFTRNDEINQQLLLNTFLKFIKYGHYNFNFSNYAVAARAGVKITTNYIIELTGKEYISNIFTKSFKQSLQKASAYPHTYSITSAAEAIKMYKDIYGYRLKNIKETDYKNLIKLTEILIPQNKCFARKITNGGGDTISIALILADESRLYNLINANNSEGRKTESNYLLYSQIFNEFACKGLLFDLEGSELPGVKNFYKKTGALNQPYYRMYVNNLPLPLKLFKALPL